MKKKYIFLLCAGIIAYAGIIWLVRTNDVATNIARWVCVACFSILFLDWLGIQVAGFLLWDTVGDYLAAAFLPICAIVLCVFPLFIAVVIR